jgi:monofunctional biosynthetic peptidoglycan transglycosylase
VSETGPRSSRRRRIALRIVAGLAGLLVLTLLWQLLTWPDVSDLATEEPGRTAFMRRWESQERRAGREPRLRHDPVPLSRISKRLQLAVLVAEDDAFFDHDGFARAEIRKAIDEAIEKREAPRGASTITQQLAKNLWLSPSRNPWRKVKETLLTMQLERELEKRRILELYLNVAEMGPGIYGAEAASRHWFGKPASGLTDDEAAQLAASLPRPSSWHPGVSSRGYASRVAMIRDRMRRWPWVLKSEP